MRKMYMIVAPNPVNHGEDLMAFRQLDLEQYSLIEGIFDELNVGNRYFRIAEIPIRVIDYVMRKVYMIVAPNPVNHGEDLMAIRWLDLEQYSLIEGIFDELNVGNRYFRIAEIPIRVIDRVTVTGRGNILICSNADCLEIDQRVKADFLNTVFEVSSIEYITPHTTDIGVVLRPNDQVLEIPLGSTLEVLP